MSSASDVTTTFGSIDASPAAYWVVPITRSIEIFKIVFTYHKNWKHLFDQSLLDQDVQFLKQDRSNRIHRFSRVRNQFYIMYRYNVVLNVKLIWNPYLGPILSHFSLHRTHPFKCWISDIKINPAFIIWWNAL